MVRLEKAVCVASAWRWVYAASAWSWQQAQKKRRVKSCTHTVLADIAAMIRKDLTPNDYVLPGVRAELGERSLTIRRGWRPRGAGRWVRARMLAVRETSRQQRLETVRGRGRTHPQLRLGSASRIVFRCIKVGNTGLCRLSDHLVGHFLRIFDCPVVFRSL